MLWFKTSDPSGVSMENYHFITRRLLRLAGLVGDGLGDFPERGVDSWLPAVPLAVDTVWKHFFFQINREEVISPAALFFSLRTQNVHLNWWTMETCSCETSLHLWENHGPAKMGGGRTMQTLTLCILQKERSCRHVLVSYLSVWQQLKIVIVHSYLWNWLARELSATSRPQQRTKPSVLDCLLFHTCPFNYFMLSLSSDSNCYLLINVLEGPERCLSNN